MARDVGVASGLLVVRRAAAGSFAAGLVGGCGRDAASPSQSCRITRAERLRYSLHRLRQGERRGGGAAALPHSLCLWAAARVSSVAAPHIRCGASLSTPSFAARRHQLSGHSGDAGPAPLPRRRGAVHRRMACWVLPRLKRTVLVVECAGLNRSRGLARIRRAMHR